MKDIKVKRSVSLIQKVTVFVFKFVINCVVEVTSRALQGVPLILCLDLAN